LFFTCYSSLLTIKPVTAVLRRYRFGDVIVLNVANTTSIKKILVVGGSDPSGGAGIQADMKTAIELGIYPYTALAAVTAQNSSGVSNYKSVSAMLLGDQIDMVLDDGPVLGLKTGMLGSSENILEIVRLLSDRKIEFSVIDPVIKANDGKMLASEASAAVLRKRLIPICYMVTPNTIEAQLLTGVTIKNENDLLSAAKVLIDTGVKWVLIKGGHLDGEMAVDLLYDGDKEYFFEAKKISSANVRGTGCMMATAVCSFLVRGVKPDEAVDKAKAYVFRKIKKAAALGKGSLQALHGSCINLSMDTEANIDVDDKDVDVIAGNNAGADEDKDAVPEMVQSPTAKDDISENWID
jgi:hydroxymethylpyrimidine/phosphomethylpyrimidine kinase